MQSCSNLTFGAEIPDFSVRWNYVARTFPGALPYVMYHDKERVGMHTHALGCPQGETMRWERSYGQHTHALWASPNLEWTLEYGRSDWPDAAQRVVLVGEMNPYQDRPDFDLYDLPVRASGHRLRTLVLDVPRVDYYRRFVMRNLCVERWSAPAARKRAAELAEACPTQTFVLLGKKVRDAFGIYSAKDFDVIQRERTVVLLPHPSGLCRAWNEPGAVRRAQAVLVEACPGLRGVIRGRCND